MLVVERWANVKIVLATEVPGETCAGIFMYHDKVSDWSNVSGIVIKGGVEVRPISHH